MNRARLTALYLDEIGRTGARASELLGGLAGAELMGSGYFGRYLSRPLFIGHAERDQLHANVAQLRAALVRLPDALYGGDLAAFARAVGAGDAGIRFLLRSRSSEATQLARADLYARQSGFGLLEFNVGSPVGGIDSADLCRGLLAHPVLAEFAETHRLSFVDTMREHVRNILAETGFSAGCAPVVAVTDWPSSYARIGPYLHGLTERWQELGLDASACHIGELDMRRGRVWLRGRRVDVVYRVFLLEHLTESAAAPALMEPVIEAAARGEVVMFTPLDAELFGSKGALAMLSDENNRHLFSAAELASFDAILPWTRLVRPGLVTLEDGRRADLMDYAVTHQGDLVLKPAFGHGGRGVLLGWRHSTSASAWRQRLGRAMGGPFVIQRRVRPVPELFPDDDGEEVPWIVTWGTFTMTGGHGGFFNRATRVDADQEVINLDAGASVGCSLSAGPCLGTS